VLCYLELQQVLRARLLHLNFHAFAHGMSDLLKAVGFDTVELAGRTNWKGRNKEGGYDLLALAPNRFFALAAVGGVGGAATSKPGSPGAGATQAVRPGPAGAPEERGRVARGVFARGSE
jgi:hypothetical protein